MTRLTEALERARTAAGAAAPAPTRPAFDVPEDWKFGGDPSVAEPVAPAADVPTDGPVERMSSASVPSATAAAAERPAENSAPLVSEPGGKLLVPGQGDTVVVEQYRRLAAVLHHAQLQRQTRTVIVASAVPSEGKTLTSTNLALTLSQSYQKRVLLIDADLRRPSVHALFDVPNDTGLTTSLREPGVTRLPVRRVSANLWVLTAGKSDPNPMSLLTSDVMKQLLIDATTQFDWVIVDTPPVGLMPDANLLAAMVDAAIVVVDAGVTPYPLVRKAVDALGAARVLGVVLNRAQKLGLGSYQDEYSYYTRDEAYAAR